MELIKKANIMDEDLKKSILEKLKDGDKSILIPFPDTLNEILIKAFSFNKFELKDGKVALVYFKNNQRNNNEFLETIDHTVFSTYLNIIHGNKEYKFYLAILK